MKKNQIIVLAALMGAVSLTFAAKADDFSLTGMFRDQRGNPKNKNSAAQELFGEPQLQPRTASVQNTTFLEKSRRSSLLEQVGKLTNRGVADFKQTTFPSKRHVAAQVAPLSRSPDLSGVHSDRTAGNYRKPIGTTADWQITGKSNANNGFQTFSPSGGAVHPASYQRMVPDSATMRGLAENSFSATAAQAGFESASYGDPAGDYPDGGIVGNLWDYYHSINDRFWVRTDALYWRNRGQQPPALASLSPNGTSLSTAGRLPGAKVLFGDEQVDTDWRLGGRARLGYWLVDGQFEGIQLEYFGLERDGAHFFQSEVSSGNILARPFFNTDPGVNAEVASLLSGPTVTLGGFTYDIDGQIQIDTDTDIHSAGALFRHVWRVDFDRNYRIDYLLGYRYFRLDDSLSVTDVITLRNPSGGTIPTGTRLRRIDRFDTQNDFHGGEFGLIGEFHWCRLSLEAIGKLALGNMHEVVEADGSVAQQTGGVGAFNQSAGAGGLLVQPDRGGAELNMGRTSRDSFAMMPEVELNVGLQLTDHWRAVAGYNLIFINRVVRSGQQIDRNINDSFVAPNTPSGTGSPTKQFNESYFWMHGWTAGLEARW